MLSCWNENFATYWLAIDATVNTIVTGTTAVACLYLVIVMGHWWWRLKDSKTNLRPLIGGIVLAKLGILTWASINIFGLVYYGGVQQPLNTLPGRVLIMIAALVQVWVTTRLRPVQDLLQEYHQQVHDLNQKILALESKLEVSQAVNLDILLVDDNEQLGRRWSYEFERRGYVIRRVTHADAALSAPFPKIALIDILLDEPGTGMDGLDLARALRERGYTGYILAITGGASIDKASDVFNEVLLKPMLFEDLLAIVVKYIGPPIEHMQDGDKSW